MALPTFWLDVQLCEDVAQETHVLPRQVLEAFSTNTGMSVLNWLSPRDTTHIALRGNVTFFDAVASRVGLPVRIDVDPSVDLPCDPMF